MLLHERLNMIGNPLAGCVNTSSTGFRAATSAGDIVFHPAGVSGSVEQFTDDATGLEVSCDIECLDETLVLRSTICNSSDDPVRSTSWHRCTLCSINSRVNGRTTMPKGA